MFELVSSATPDVGAVCSIEFYKTFFPPKLFCVHMFLIYNFQIKILNLHEHKIMLWYVLFIRLKKSYY